MDIETPIQKGPLNANTPSITRDTFVSIAPGPYSDLLRESFGLLRVLRLPANNAVTY